MYDCNEQANMKLVHRKNKGAMINFGRNTTDGAKIMIHGVVHV